MGKQLVISSDKLKEKYLGGKNIMDDFYRKVLTAEQGKTHIFSIGQAGYIIKSRSGQLLGIDMYLSDCVERIEGHVGFKRLLPKILDPFGLEFDIIIATHPHCDHFDIDSMPQLMSNKKTHLFASVNCETEVKRLNMTDRNCTYVKHGDHYDCGDYSLDFVSCDHGNRVPDAVGVIISIDGRKIYETGDTCLRLDSVDEYKVKGTLDVMIAPINGAYGNLNEAECADLSYAINPKITIPCHYGMFASHGGNPGLFHKIMSEKYPNNAYILMCLGEMYTL